MTHRRGYHRPIKIGGTVVVLGIEGWKPEWHHDAEALAATHRHMFVRLIGRKLRSSQLMWDVAQRGWFADGPVILDFGLSRVEITHRKFDECAITWDQIDTTLPIDLYEHFDWRSDPHAALRKARGRALRAVNVIERTTSADWRPRVLHAVEFLFDGARLAVYNAMDENGITDVPAADLPAAHWRRVHIA